MSGVVIDASVAIKWVVEEEGTPLALSLRRDKISAPDLLAPECANVLWKKVVRGELTHHEAAIAARLLAMSNIELLGTRSYLESATRMAVALNHPAYDCVYLALALSVHQPLVTADETFVRSIRTKGTREMKDRIRLLAEVAA